jgi:hypothetical protein
MFPEHPYSVDPKHGPVHFSLYTKSKIKYINIEEQKTLCRPAHLPLSSEVADKRHTPLQIGGQKCFENVLKMFCMESTCTSPCSSLIGYLLKWRCCSLV